jgi:hypothetical protein
MTGPDVLAWATFGAAAVSAGGAVGGAVTGHLKFRHEILLPAVEIRPYVDGTAHTWGKAAMDPTMWDRMAITVRNRGSSVRTVYSLGVNLGRFGGSVLFSDWQNIKDPSLPDEPIQGPTLPMELRCGQRAEWLVAIELFGQVLDTAPPSLRRAGRPCVEMGDRLYVARVNKTNFHRIARTAHANWESRRHVDRRTDRASSSNQ